jgi:hypothetical protein
MIQQVILVKQVVGEVFETPEGIIGYLSPVVGEIQQGDYINLIGLVAYLQDLSKVNYTRALQQPINFGLVNKYNVPMVTLQINY